MSPFDNPWAEIHYLHQYSESPFVKPRAVTTSRRIRSIRIGYFLSSASRQPAIGNLKYHALVGFYRYATSRKYILSSPLPTTVPKASPRFVPYIYREDEVRRLLDATNIIPASHILFGATYISSSSAVALRSWIANQRGPRTNDGGWLIWSPGNS